MRTKLLKRILGTSLLCFWLSGCGFALRGTLERPLWLECISIAAAIGNVHQDVLFALKENFQSIGIAVVPPESKEAFHLIIEKEWSQQQLTSVSASTTPRQYELRYVLVYSLITKEGAPLISSDTVTVARPLTVNNNRILGSDFESMLTYKEMHQEAVMQIVARIAKIKPVPHHVD